MTSSGPLIKDRYEYLELFETISFLGFIHVIVAGGLLSRPLAQVIVFVSFIEDDSGIRSISGISKTE